MPAARRALSVDRMTERQLYDHARVLVARCRMLYGAPPRERELTLDHLDAVLIELKMRGSQLSLLQTSESS